MRSTLPPVASLKTYPNHLRSNESALLLKLGSDRNDKYLPKTQEHIFFFIFYFFTKKKNSEL